MKKTIAVTDLDAYRWFMNSEQEWEEFAARLMRRAPASIAAAVGTDLHNAISELSAKGEREFEQLVTQRGRVAHTFNMPAMPEMEVLPVVSGTFEVPVRYSVGYDGGEVELRGYIDMVDTMGEIWEFKSTSSPSGWSERYFAAMQWRVYALAYNSSDPVHYAVFFLKYDRKKVQKNGVVQVTDVAELELNPYPSMAQEVQLCAAEFARMIDSHLPAYWRRREDAIRAAPMRDLLRHPQRYAG